MYYNTQINNVEMKKRFFITNSVYEFGGGGHTDD